MSLPEIANREEWTRARVVLLEQEKALTKARDELAAARMNAAGWLAAQRDQQQRCQRCAAVRDLAWLDS
jgi:predicted dithiol-disulfide oxidoreductase (DUF899 family)